MSDHRILLSICKSDTYNGLFAYVSFQEGEVYINDTFYVPLKLFSVKVFCSKSNLDFELYMTKIQS